MSHPLPASLAKDNPPWHPLTCPPHQQDLLCSCPGSCFPWTLCHFCHPEGLRHLEANCRQAKPQLCPVWRGGRSERASAPPVRHVGQQIPLKPAADESWCLGHGGQQAFLPGPLPGCRGARLSDCRAAFRLTELGFLEEGLSHCLSFVGWKERGIRRSTAQELLPSSCTLGRAGACTAGLWEQALLWHPYLWACAAGTAAPCRCPGGWRSGSPSGHRTSHPLSSSAHCRAGGGGGSQGRWGLCPNPPAVLPQPKNTMGKISR